MPAKPDPRLKRAGVSGYNKPKRTPNHKTKSHVVVAKSGNQIKTIRFGQQGVKGAGKNPKSAKQKARKSSFKDVCRILGKQNKVVTSDYLRLRL
jgi:hypothetical protein